MVDAGEVIRLRLDGELDLATVRELESVVAGLPQGYASIEVDMAGVTFIDSTGLNALVWMRAACADGGAGIVVVSPSDVVRRLLELGGLTQVLTITE